MKLLHFVKRINWKKVTVAAIAMAVAASAQATPYFCIYAGGCLW